MVDLVQFAEEVQSALEEERAVVALETTLVAHGFPAPEGIEVARAAEQAVRAAGAVPATIGVLDGEVRIGLGEEELERFTPDARKLGPRDLAPFAVQRAVGATTVGGTLAAAATVGIRFLGTGDIGGVHRGFPTPPDVSADLGALAKIPALVVSAGVKSILDVPATTELLETLGVPLIAYRTGTLPLFYAAEGGPETAARAETPEEAARMADAHWRLGGNGIVVGRAPDESIDVEPLIEEALEQAALDGVTGQEVTPFVLDRLHRRSGGDTLRVNRDLVVANAALAGAIAKEHEAL